jgi:hypothetical protein
MTRKSANHAAPPKAPSAHAAPFDLSTFTAIGAEDLDAIAHIQAGLVDHYQPANSEELFAIERIALARHSLLRTYRMESGLISYGLQKASQTPGDPRILRDPEEPGDPLVTAGQKSSFWMAAGFCEANKTSVWQFFLRYQSQTERFYRHAIEEFERLRRHRGRIPEQTVVEPAPGPAAGRPPTTEPGRPPTTEPGRPPTTEPGRPPSTEPGRPPTTEPARPPTTEPPKPKQQFVDPAAVAAPAQPAAALSRQPRRVSHRRRPTRTSSVVPRTRVVQDMLPASSQPRPRQAAATGLEAGLRQSVRTHPP